jgi:hypothetical protein
MVPSSTEETLNPPRQLSASIVVYNPIDLDTHTYLAAA